MLSYAEKLKKDERFVVMMGFNLHQIWSKANQEGKAIKVTTDLAKWTEGKRIKALTTS